MRTARGGGAPAFRRDGARGGRCFGVGDGTGQGLDFGPECFAEQGALVRPVEVDGFEHEIGGAAAQGGEGGSGIGVGQSADHDNGGAGIELQERVQNLDAVDQRHVDVQGQHVGAFLPRQSDGLRPVRRFPHDFDPGVRRQEGIKKSSEDDGVVGQNHPPFHAVPNTTRASIQPVGMARRVTARGGADAAGGAVWARGLST